MPRRDGTGPMGLGSMTGRGLGLCTRANAVKYGASLGMGMGLGLGLACRRGFGRGRAINQLSPKTQKDILQNQLEIINKQLENL